MGIRIALIADVHANLPALEAALAAIDMDGCDAIVHLGDAITIGPYPAECLDLLLNRSDIRFVMGNHDDWFARGLPVPRPSWMSEDEAAHQHWTHARIDPSRRAVVATWPFEIDESIEGLRLRFVHYALDQTGHGFRWLGTDPRLDQLDDAFGNGADVICFGHDHTQRDVMGRARYINPSALGCSVESLARYALMEIASNHVSVNFRSAPYDNTAVFRAFEDRQVPEREFITRTFFGRR